MNFQEKLQDLRKEKAIAIAGKKEVEDTLEHNRKLLKRRINKIENK